MKRPYLNDSERLHIRIGDFIGALCELDLAIKKFIREVNRKFPFSVFNKLK